MNQPVRERDSMICRHCGNQERASEGYPCSNCGTFICIICTFRGFTLCTKCTESVSAPARPSPFALPKFDWPED